MELRIKIDKKHVYILAVLTMLLLGGMGAFAFGGNNPSVLGHSAAELIVNSTSVVDDSLGAADIDSTSLATECSTITGSAGLCDGADNGITSENDPEVGSLSAGGICFTSGGSSVQCDNPSGFGWNGGAQTMTVGAGAGVITMNSGALVMNAAGSPVTISSTGNININSASGTGFVNILGSLSSTGTMGPGGTTVVRCTAGSFNGVLTTQGVSTCLGLGGDASNTDTGLRVD